MAYNMPAGCTPSDYDRWMGYDQPQRENPDTAYEEESNDGFTAAPPSGDDSGDDPFAWNEHVAEPFRSVLNGIASPNRFRAATVKGDKAS